jgi:hypothetical protein
MFYIGTFAFVGAVAWMVFLPGEAWERWARWAPERFRRSEASDPAGGRVGTAVNARRRSVRGRALAAYAPAFVLAYVAVVNALAHATLYAPTMKTWTYPRVKQVWNFMGKPLRSTGWLVVDARLRDGTTIGLLSPPDVDHPSASDLIWPETTARTLRYRTGIWTNAERTDIESAAAFARRLRAEWDAAHADPRRRVKDIWVYHAQPEIPKHGEYVGARGLKYVQIWPPVSVAP